MIIALVIYILSAVYVLYKTSTDAYLAGQIPWLLILVPAINTITALMIWKELD